jgi:hypothetical protein
MEAPKRATNIHRKEQAMHRKLKVLGVTLVALFALSAVAASSALATEGVFTPGASNATITASQVAGGKAKLTLGSTAARSVECSVVHLDSTETLSNSTTSTASFGQEYSGCITSPGGGAATVSSLGCDISVTLDERFTASTGQVSGGLSGASCDLKILANSTAGSKICEYTVPNQTATGAGPWKNVASTPSDDVVVSLNNMQLSVNVLFGVASACGASAGNSTIGKLSGEITVTAEVGSVPTSLTIS